ncbi:MAG TPA: RNA polymerase sigma factor [Baekduia sp.]
MAATALDLRARRLAARKPGFGADDDRLVTRVRAGDDAAFEAIYDRYASSLLAFCRHMLSSRDDAEDALQHSLGAAYRMMRATDRRIELRPWLYAIARNRCLTVLRARRKDISLDVAPDPGGITDEVVDQVQRRSDLRDLVQDLRLLPDDQRAALVLFELGGLPHHEIASVLDVRPDKVKALVFQAREGLMRARRARNTPCTEMRRQLATLAGGIPTRSMLRRHVDRCPSCALFEAEVGRQRAGLALILPVAPAVGLKAVVLSSTLGRGTAVAGGGAGAGGGAAVLGGAGGAGGATSAGAGGIAGVAGAGAGAGAGVGAAASGSVLAGAAGGTVSGALATAGGAGTMAALGAKSASVAVAKLLTVAAVIVGGSAANGDPARFVAHPDKVSAEQQAATPVMPVAAPSPAALAPSPLAPPVPAAAPPVPAAAATAAANPLAPPAPDPSLKPIVAAQPPAGTVGSSPAASVGGSPATDAPDAPATPTPATTAPPAGPPTDTATMAPSAAPTDSTTTAGAPALGATTPTAATTTAPGDPTGGATAPGTTTTAPGDPAGGAPTPTSADPVAPQTGSPGAVESPSPPTADPATTDVTP